MNIKEDLLYLDSRKKIYNTVLKNPGIHQRQLERITNIGSSSLRYHLLRLIKYGIIIRKYDYGYCRYFVSKNVDNGDKRIINFLRQDIPRKIIVRLVSYNSHTKKQIKDIEKPLYWIKEDIDKYTIKLDLTTINYHLQKLMDAGIVERIRNGRKISYRLVDLEKIIILLITYEDTFNDFIVQDTINFYKSKKYEKGFTKRINYIINGFKEVFPPPFYI
jgi:predicted transcriptional regulator